MGEMQPKSDAQLLREYAETGAEPAFTEIVNRHTNLVYSAALRQVESPGVAAEIAQKVFIGLARGARELCPRLAAEASLAGWLCRSARNLSLNFRRDEFRRQSRERQAMEQLSSIPDAALDWERLRVVLDDAMSELSERDHDALVLRFFQKQDFRSVGLALGMSDDGAQKCVSRALEKLREHFSRRNINTTAAALSIAISANAVQAAPAGLALSIANTAAATASMAGAATTSAFLKSLFASKAAAVVAGVVTIGAAVPFIAWHHTQVRLRTENHRLHDEVDRLTAEQQRLNDLTASASVLPPLTDAESNELQRLRAETARLRADSQQLAQLKAATQMQDPDFRTMLIKQRLDAAPEWKIPELQLLHDEDWLSVAKMPNKLETEDDFRRAFSRLRQFAKQEFGTEIVKVLHRYVRTNYGQLPSDLSQLMPYVPAAVTAEMLDRYELKQTGLLKEVQPLGQYGSPGHESPDTVRTAPIIVERAPVDDQFDTMLSIEAYGLSTREVNGGGTGSVSWKVRRDTDGMLELVIPPPINGSNEMVSEPESGTAQENINPTGIWTWYQYRGGGGSSGPGGGSGSSGTRVKVLLKLQDDEGKLTGTLTESSAGNPGTNEIAISSAEIVGNRIAFSVVRGGRFGSPSIIRYTGTFTTNTIVGAEGDYLKWNAERVR